MEIALPLPDTIGRLQKRICTEFALVVEEWAGCIQALTLWEEEHLLDQPSAENLALWHGSRLCEKESNRILARVFPDEP